MSKQSGPAFSFSELSSLLYGCTGTGIGTLVHYQQTVRPRLQFLGAELVVGARRHDDLGVAAQVEFESKD